MIKRLYIWFRCLRYKPNGGKPWGYREAGWIDKDTKEILQPRPCYQCKGSTLTRDDRNKRPRKESRKLHRRYMLALRGRKKGQALCIWHYVLRTPVEADRLLLKLNRPLAIACSALLIWASASTFMALSRSRIPFRSTVSSQQIENVVDEIAARGVNVCREILTQEVETIGKYSPNLAFFAYVCGIVDVESAGTWDPATRGKIKNKAGKWVPGQARGIGGVLDSHLAELKKAGIVPKDADVSILHHPVYGARSCVYYAEQYLRTAKGVTRQGLKIYLQGEGDKYANVEWNMKLDDYFTRAVNAAGRFILVLDTKKAPAEAPAKTKK